MEHYLGHRNIQHAVRYTELASGRVQRLLAGLKRRAVTLWQTAFGN